MSLPWPTSLRRSFRIFLILRRYTYFSPTLDYTFIIQNMAKLVPCLCMIQAMIFFSAHGVPVSYVENSGDPYQKQMEECIFLIMEELKARGVPNEHILAYQVWSYYPLLALPLYMDSCNWLAIIPSFPEPCWACSMAEAIHRWGSCGPW